MKQFSLLRFTFIVLLFSAAINASAQSWSALGNGMDDYVTCITQYNGDIIAGGSFTQADGVLVNYIARWDGNSWQALGSGMNAQVDALIVYDGKLIAGGRFTKANGLLVNHIAQWNGSTWSAMQGGTNNFVSALTIYEGKLIAGGFFTTAYIPALHIAEWDGSSWGALGSGMTGSGVKVTALAVYGSDLVAGGSFSIAGGNVVKNIAKWDGMTWSALGAGTDSAVSSLKTFGSLLFAGGTFTQAGSVLTKGIAAWNGSSWGILGSGLSGTVNINVTALDVYNNRLIVGGIFQKAGNIVVNSVARWDGMNWTGMGGGVNYSGSITNINGLYAAPTVLYAGGAFDHAGIASANYIAQWIEPGVGLEEPVTAVAEGLTLEQNYPDPFEQSTSIRFSLPVSGKVKLSIIDVAGREIALIVNENLQAGSYRHTFSGEGLAGGVYFCRLEGSCGFAVRKMLKQ